MKLLGSSKSKKTKDENDENVPHLKITGEVLVHYNAVNNDYLQNSRVICSKVKSHCVHLLLIDLLVNN